MAMSDSYTETITTGWFSRIGDSIKGILIGLIMVVLAFPVLFWNEGRAVKTRKDLDQGAKECVSANAATLDSNNEGKLVHITGKATSKGTLRDEKFQVSVEALKLKRVVEMYQWKEKTKTSTKKEVGGKEKKTTTYTYKKVWAPGRIDSGKFKKSKGHKNPAVAIDSYSWAASPITVGEYTLSTRLISQIDNYTSLHVSKPENEIEPIAGREVKYTNGQFYLGEDEASPAIGDLKITFKSAMPTDVSILAQQNGNSFSPFTGDSGTIINTLTVGTHTAQSMFNSAQNNNKLLTWGLRLLGFFLMFFGFKLISAPLAVVADVLPIAGSIVGIGTGIVSFLLSAPLSLITIAVAWVFYRPLIGIPLLILAGLGITFLIMKIMGLKKAHS